MAGKIFITGGASSGKSGWAVSHFKNCGEVLYICTGDKPGDDVRQCMEQAQGHNAGWDVSCVKRNIASAVSDKYRYYVFDNLAEFVQNFILTLCHDPDHITDEQISEIRSTATAETEKLLEAVQNIDGGIVVVSLETGFSLRSHMRAERAFSDILSAVNRKAAQMCDEVYLSISGVQVKLR